MNAQSLCRAALQPQGRARLARWMRASMGSPIARLLNPCADEISEPDLCLVVPGRAGRFDWPEGDLADATPAVALRFETGNGRDDFAALTLPDGRVLTRFGAALAGQTDLAIARAAGEPLQIYANPLRWWLARRGPLAICVFCWDRARQELEDVSLVAPSLKAAEVIEARLTVRPRIFVRAAG